MNIYISGALASAKNLAVARKLYEKMAERCAQAGGQPYLPHKRTDPIESSHLSDEAVASIDLNALRNSDCVVACLSDPSTGVGAELALAVAADKPVVAVWHSDAVVSRFILGFMRAHDRFCGLSYRDETKALDWVEAQVARLVAARFTNPQSSVC